MPQPTPSALEPANPPSAWTRMLVQLRCLQLKTARSPALVWMAQWALRWCPPTLSRGRYHLLCSRPVGLINTSVSCTLMLCAYSDASWHGCTRIVMNRRNMVQVAPVPLVCTSLCVCTTRVPSSSVHTTPHHMRCSEIVPGAYGKVSQDVQIESLDSFLALLVCCFLPYRSEVHCHCCAPAG